MQKNKKYVAGDGYRIIDNSTFDNGKANYWNVPVYIVGYKTGLFGGQS